MVLGTNHMIAHCNDITLWFGDKLIEKVSVFFKVSLYYVW